MVSWAAGRRAGGSRLRLLDGAADRTDRNRLELLGGVAEAYVFLCFSFNFCQLLANFWQTLRGPFSAGWLAGKPVLGCIRIRIRSRSVFEKKENLGVCAKQKVRLTRLGKYYVVQYYTLYRCAEKSISLFRLPI